MGDKRTRKVWYLFLYSFCYYHSSISYIDNHSSFKFNRLSFQGNNSIQIKSNIGGLMKVRYCETILYLATP